MCWLYKPLHQAFCRLYLSSSIKNAQDKSDYIMRLPPRIAWYERILPSLHSPPLPDFPRRASPDEKNLVNQGESPMSPEVPSKAFKSFVSWLLSGSGCQWVWIVSVGWLWPFPRHSGVPPKSSKCHRCLNHYWQNGLVSRDKLLSS